MRLTSHILALAALALPLAAPMVAQDPDSQERGVARISVMNGDVSVRRGDSGDVVAAAVNAPLVVQDRVLTGEGSRAEVQFDYANMMRIASNTEIRLAELADRHYLVQIAHGMTTFRVLRHSQSNTEISTPQVSVRPIKEGVYRIVVREDGQTEITVRSGEAEIYTTRGVEKLHARQSMMVRGTSSDPEFQTVGAFAEDDWDRWNQGRDRELERSAAYRYVSPDVYGAEDLDPYGSWVYDAPYGYVWAPRVAVGWAPYRTGHWVWVDWYGWSWVSYEPWGWAPYHYGRWYYGPTHGWCWYPGVIGVRHYWSPALVGFVGFGGGGVGVGFGFGRVGWVPLAPYEPLHPWWGRGYYGGGFNRTNVNIVNNVNITNVYRNARIRNGVTEVNGNEFGRGGMGRAANAAEFRQASLVRGQLPVTPHAESLRLSNRQPGQSALARSNDNMRFFSHQQPAQVNRVPFSQQRQSFDPGSRPAVNGPQHGAGPAQNAGATGGTLGTAHADNAFRRFGNSPQSNSNASGGPAQASRGGFAGPQSAAPTARSDNGWRRFGEPNPTGSSRGQAAAGPGNNNSWRGFGAPSSADRPRSANRNSESAGPRDRGSVSPSGPATDNGQRFGRGSDRPSGGYADHASPETQQRFRGSPDSGRGFSGGSQGSIHVSPPLVRERSAPAPASRQSAPSYSYRGGGGGGGHSGNNSGGGGGRHR